MKHKIENGKWKPDNGTFVKVPNEQIPELVKMFWQNDFLCDYEMLPKLKVKNPVFQWQDDAWYLGEHEINPCIELPFPDFKALVTGKLPESWCIQCTEEISNSVQWENMINAIDVEFSIRQCFIGWYYGINDVNFPDARTQPFGKVLQIETWAAVSKGNSQSLTSKTDTELFEVMDKGGLSEKPAELLINELKLRGYTISKIY